MHAGLEAFNMDAIEKYYRNGQRLPNANLIVKHKVGQSRLRFYQIDVKADVGRSQAERPEVYRLAYTGKRIPLELSSP